MSDGLNLCADCGGAYTLTRYCRLCAEQRMIDAGHDVPVPVQICDYCGLLFDAGEIAGEAADICPACYEWVFGDD